MERLFKFVYLAGILAEIILRMPYERQRRQIPKIDQRVSRTERGLLAVLHPPDLQPDLVARFCQLPLVACHESSRGKHRDRVARSGDLAVLALAPRSWEELVAVIRNQCSANPHYPWRVSHDPSPDVCLWVAIEPCPSLAPAELDCWARRCGGIPALICRTSTARRANDARSLWR